MKQKEGFAPVIIAIAVVVVVGVAGFVLMNKSKPGGALPQLKIPGTAGLGLNANCKLNDPELCRYMDKSIKMANQYAQGFVGRSTTTDKTGKKSENIWEMANEKSHFSTYENGKLVSDMIMIGNSTYTKDMADGKWIKFTYESKEGEKSLFSFDPETIKEQFKDVIKDIEDKTVYRQVGKEACGSLQCFKYEIQNPLSLETKEYLYFDDKEYIMRKMRIEDKSGTITETEFEFRTVTISEPSPIKESENQQMYDPAALQEMMQGDDSASSVDTQQMQENAQKFLEQMGQTEESPGEE